MEFSRLFGNDSAGMADKFQITGPNVTVLQKGFNDIIYNSSDGINSYEQVTGGGGRRCSGQGDILAGTIAVFYHWAINAKDPNPAKVAAYAGVCLSVLPSYSVEIWKNSISIYHISGSYLVKKLNSHTFRTKGRSMCASDMIEKIHEVFEMYFEGKQKQ